MSERNSLWRDLQRGELSSFQLEEGVWRFKSPIEGPHLWVVGAIHGNEAVGAVIVQALLARALSGSLISRGTVTMVIGNPEAFLRDVRYIEEDLNRAFHQELNACSSLEGLRQVLLAKLLASDPPDFVLDLHSVSRGDHGIIVYPTASSMWAERLGCLETHFCYDQDHMAGATLIDAAQALGAGVMVVECGHHHSPKTVDVAMSHISRLFNYFEMNGSPEEVDNDRPARVIRFLSVAMIKPGPNFRFTHPLETGSELDKGQCFAVDDDQEHITDNRVWVMMPSLTVHPTDADAGWLCRREVINL